MLEIVLNLPWVWILAAVIFIIAIALMLRTPAGQERLIGWSERIFDRLFPRSPGAQLRRQMREDEQALRAFWDGQRHG